MNLGPNSPIWAVFFWVNVVLCVTLGIWIFRNLEKDKKRLKDYFKEYYLRQFRWLFRREIKDHYVDIGEAAHDVPKKNASN
ncbi:MAG: hypothetical protein WC450_12155 [Candidatus Omnitrophota bacterium]|jgi:hypothetical protein